MARQNIGIGAAPNDDTGDSLRVGADKANDNFIELYSMFDAWPGNFSYWPLGGAATLTDNFALDGDGNDLSFSNVNLFGLDAAGEILISSDDRIALTGANEVFLTSVIGADECYVSMEPTVASIGSTDATAVSLATFQPESILLSSDDGVDSSTLSLTPLGASFDRPIQLPSYTVGTLPAAATYPRCLVWVSDETDGACEAISNGTNWIRTYDGTVVS